MTLKYNNVGVYISPNKKELEQVYLKLFLFKLFVVVTYQL